MSSNDIENARRKYLHRAVSILAHTNNITSLSSQSLDTLCDVSIFYMQSLFSQIHSFSEHATRTRPNMNDVGRALESRYITVKSLDDYYHKEKASLKRSHAVRNAVKDLNACVATMADGTDHIGSNEKARVFFDNDAERLLRDMLDHKRKVMTEKRRVLNEERKRQFEAKAAAEAEKANKDGVGDEAKGDAGSSTQQIHHLATTTSMPSYGDDSDDDDDDEEDDFEAPAASSILHTQSIPQQQQDEATPSDTSTSIFGQQELQEEESTVSSNAENKHVTDQIQAPNELNKEKAGGGGSERVTQDDAPGKGSDAVVSVQQDEDDEENVFDMFLLPSTSLPSYIPTQCPGFPNPHTYKQTPVFPKRSRDIFEMRIRKARQSRQAEENLQKLIGDSQLYNKNSSASNSNNSGSTDNTTNNDRNEKASSVAGNGKDNINVQASLENLFPPANFRNANKRTRLSRFFEQQAIDNKV